MKNWKKIAYIAVLIFQLSFGSEEKFEEEFGVEATDDEQKEFETKAHYDPGTFYYVLKTEPHQQSNNKQYRAQVATSSVQSQKNTRPVWKPIFTNNFGFQARPSFTSNFQPKIQQTWATPAPTVLPTLPPLTPKDIPEQLRLLGYNVLADLIERADLTEALQSRGPFTVFAPTDEAFQKFIGKRGDEYEDVILGDKTLLQYILLQHVAPEKLRSTDLKSGMTIKTLADNSMTILDTKDGLTFAGALFFSGGLNQVATNGIIHAIEDVVYPYVSEEQATTPRPSINRLFGQRTNDPSLIIRTKDGRVRGTNMNEDVRAWLGIPYSEPPVGRYRFSRPRQLKAWDRDFVKDAITLPKACPQTPDEFFGNFSGSQAWNPNTEISEDCLYLNVYTPKDIDETENLPVLVWIYGGGYMTGSSSLELYNPQEIVKMGRIIFVSMQYRVGAHGFLYFGQDSSSPGNVGLLDQTMALEWIRDNIKYFGGNPKEVTIMGESAGANSVALHMMSPLSCGLFKRAILQSAGATPRWGFITREEALNRSIKLAEELNCSYDKNAVEDTLECLRDKDFDAITSKEYFVGDYILNYFPFVPTVDDTFMPRSPKTMLEMNYFKDISILIGSNANEGFWSLMYLLPDMFPNNELKVSDRTLTEEKYMEAVSKIFSFYPESMQKLIAHEYMDKFSGPESLYKSLDLMAGDSDLTCNTEEFAQIMANSGNRVYRYYYNHQSSLDAWPTWSGSKHGDEIEFTFGLPLQEPKQYSAAEIKFSRDILTYWTNFVKNGSPNPSNAWATWPEYKAPEWKYLNLTVGLTGLTGMKNLDTQCRFFNKVVPEFVSPVQDDSGVDVESLVRYSC